MRMIVLRTKIIWQRKIHTLRPTLQAKLIISTKEKILTGRLLKIVTADFRATNTTSLRGSAPFINIKARIITYITAPLKKNIDKNDAKLLILNINNNWKLNIKSNIKILTSFCFSFNIHSKLSVIIRIFLHLYVIFFALIIRKTLIGFAVFWL